SQPHLYLYKCSLLFCLNSTKNQFINGLNGSLEIGSAIYLHMKTYLIVFYLLSSFLLSAQQSSYERHWKSGVEKIRIISYNIFNGFDWGKDQERKERFVAWIKQQDPEVLALQELCGFTQETLSALAQQWGHSYAVILKENGYPVGVTSKKSILIKNKIHENCGHGLLHVETYDYDLLVTHLNPGDTKKRSKEAQVIIDYIKTNQLEKCLLMGDMNAHSPIDADYMEKHSCDLLLKYGGQASPNLMDGKFDYSVISHFLSLPLIDLCRIYVQPEQRITFPTPILTYLSRHKEVRRKVGERLDYVFAAPSVAQEVVDAFIWNGEDTGYLSDHYPIGIDLCIENE
uniref:endonuclease/exonuclease/phosphatase family protein n=1 Tax=Parabacteroides goldsteinii TaxID=328812 RepID=UPI0029394BC9